MDTIALLSGCLGKVMELKGQDVFFKVGAVPHTRIGNQIAPLPFDVITEDDTRGLMEHLLNPAHKVLLGRNCSVDFAFSLMGTSQRFRGNIFLQQGVYSIVLRTLWKTIPTFDELRIPPILKKMVLEKSGIILIGGTVSSGKTTTLTAMINALNENVHRHIITIEDPVEYVHKDKKCVINQREIGQDAHDFTSALKYVVRQSPDVIVLGEMRDAEAFNFAVTAAEVGRLVIGTVHAKSTVQIFDRILGFFPADEREQVLSHFSYNMACLVAQRLLPTKDGKGLMPVFEVLIGNYTMKQLVRERKFDKIPQAMRNSAAEGMQIFDDGILKLWQDGLVSTEEALSAAERPQELENSMKGIRIDGQSGKILGG